MKRIQCKNQDDLPGGTIYVGRPTLYRNPFTARRHGRCTQFKLQSQADDRQKFKCWLNGDLDKKYPRLIMRKEEILKQMKYLRGYNLACWCDKGTPCHADILLLMANA